MTRLRLALTLSLAASVLFVACGDDDENAGPGGVDAGGLDAKSDATTSGTDATTGTDAQTGTDSQTGTDAGTDATQSDAAPDVDAAVDADASSDAAPQTWTSCKALLTAMPGTASGIYLIDPDAAGPLEPLPLYCDMTFDGGGWTLIFSNTAGHALLSPGDAGSDAGTDASYYLRPPAPGAVGALRGPHAQALALGASVAHLRTPFPDGGVVDAGFITSIPLPDGGPSTAIARLRALKLMNADGDGGFVTDWTGPNANATRLNYSNTGVCLALNSTAYPEIYWACNNTAGLHAGAGMTRWNYTTSGSPSEAFEVYVR